MTDSGLNISLEINHLGQMQQKIASQLATLGSVLEAIEKADTYASDRLISGSSFSFQLDAKPDIEAWRQDEIDKTFLTMVRSLLDLVDTLLAYKEVVGEGIPVAKSLHSAHELLAYAQEYLHKEVAVRMHKVASDSRRSAHQKIRELGNLPTFSKDSLTSLLLIRRALEHHKRIPDRDIHFTVLGMAISLEGEKVELPIGFQPGQSIGVRFIETRRILPKGQPILLTTDDIQWVAITILQELVPGLQGTLTSQGAPPTFSWGIAEIRFEEIPSGEE